MIQTSFNKTDLLKAFVPLSQNGQTYLELMLVNPKTQKVEGRGFFNDPDFLLEAGSMVAGRYNITLSSFAYAADAIPGRQAFNQFDRTLIEGHHQEKGIPHSLSIAFAFKPDLFRELDPAKGNHVLQVVYLIDGILGRIPLKTFSLDFGGQSMTARFLPACAGHFPGLTRAQYLDVTRKLLERIEKEMYPQEHKKFQVLAAALGKTFDPLPGSPLILGGEESGGAISTTAGSLALANEPFFQQIFEEAVEGKKARSGDLYAPANLQGLSQGWEDPAPVASTGGLDRMEREGLGNHLGQSLGLTSNQNGLKKNGLEGANKAETKSEGGLKDKRLSDELAHYFQQAAANRWRWPLISQTFTRHHQGLGCGDMLVLQCEPFGAEAGLHYLMQCAESFARESGAQVLVFSKRHLPGELALFTMARQLKQHPYAPRPGKPQGNPPAPQNLAEQFVSSFTNPPILLHCAASETWEHVARYLEHDYLVRSKKNGSNPVPLAVIIDGVDDFRLTGDADTFRQISQVKNKLRDVNGSLWLIDPLIHDRKSCLPGLLGLADYLLRFDYDGALSGETGEGGMVGQISPDTWEFGFPIDPQLRSQGADLSLVRITFTAHGSHRRDAGAYLHLRAAGLFKELVSPTASGNAASPGVGGT